MGIGSLPCYLTEWLWVLAHKGLAKNARVRALIDFLAEAFVKHDGLLGGKGS
jgi:hypothetical protein